MVDYLKSSVAGAALLAALGAPALAASPPHSDNGAEDYEFVLPSYGNISAFSGATNPFYGGINPQYGNISPFWGNISAFWGEIDPFYGNISAFWGNISAFEGDIGPFWGNISAFWGEIGPFWGNISAFWGNISAFTEADFVKLASDLDTLFAEADAVFGPAIEAATGQSIEEAFLAELKARYGIDTSDPHALAELDAEERSAFFLEFYDSLMGYTGADRVDHWMPAIGWTPALAQRVGGASGVTVGIVDFSLPYRMPGLRGSGNNTNEYLDFNHGIAVAELIGADIDGQGLMGVAPNAALRVENPFDETLTANWADVRRSLDRLLPQSDIVNLSLGVPGSAFSSAWADVFSHRKISRHASDTLFVFAAGNDGVTQTADVDWSSVGEVENLLIVGSVNPAGEISSFSNRPGEACLTTGGTCQEGHRLMDRFLVAPGELLLVPDGEGGVVRMSGTSPTPDSSGSRDVFAAFAEASVPIVSPDMNIPLVQTFDLQLAARYEHYSDFGGSGIKPRVAAAWTPFNGLMFRGAYSEGFRAPNLIVINEGVDRSNAREDSYFCEAGVRNGTFANFAACTGYSEGRTERRSVADDIGPEDDVNITYGFVFEPEGLDGFLSILNPLTITVDRWEIEREGVVGVFGAENQISLDYLLRLQGSSNPNVVRDAPNQDQINFFNAAGLDPVGEIDFIRDTYDNNESIDVKGTDFAVYYNIDDTPLGDFDLKLNATYLETFFIALSPGAQQIRDAVDSGLISNEITVSQEGDIIQQDGQPEWRVSGSLTWRHDNGWGAGVRADYTSEFIDTGAGLDPAGDPFIVEAWTQTNAYVQYDFDRAGPLNDVLVRVGSNNIFDEDPPLADETNGYDAAYHSIRGRQVYIDVRKRF